MLLSVLDFWHFASFLLVPPTQRLHYNLQNQGHYQIYKWVESIWNNSEATSFKMICVTSCFRNFTKFRFTAALKISEIFNRDPIKGKMPLGEKIISQVYCLHTNCGKQQENFSKQQVLRPQSPPIKSEYLERELEFPILFSHFYAQILEAGVYDILS